MPVRIELRDAPCRRGFGHHTGGRCLTIPVVAGQALVKVARVTRPPNIGNRLAMWVAAVVGRSAYRFVEDLRPVVIDAPLTFFPVIAFTGLTFAVLDVTLVPAIFLVACVTNLPVAALRVADARIR